MSFGMAVSLVRQAVLQVLMMAAPVLLVGMVVGLVVAILQATTSIQEQTLTFVPKIVAIMSAVALFGPWMLSSLVEFTKKLFSVIPSLGG